MPTGGHRGQLLRPRRRQHRVHPAGEPGTPAGSAVHAARRVHAPHRRPPGRGGPGGWPRDGRGTGRRHRRGAVHADHALAGRARRPVRPVPPGDGACGCRPTSAWAGSLARCSRSWTVTTCCGPGSARTGRWRSGPAGAVAAADCLTRSTCPRWTIWRAVVAQETERAAGAARPGPRCHDPGRLVRPRRDRPRAAAAVPAAPRGRRRRPGGSSCPTSPRRGGGDPADSRSAPRSGAGRGSSPPPRARRTWWRKPRAGGRS